MLTQLLELIRSTVTNSYRCRNKDIRIVQKGVKSNDKKTKLRCPLVQFNVQQDGLETKKQQFEVCLPIISTMLFTSCIWCKCVFSCFYMLHRQPKRSVKVQRTQKIKYWMMLLLLMKKDSSYLMSRMEKIQVHKVFSQYTTA